MAAKVDFTGAASAVGLIVLGVVWLFGALIWVGVTLSVATGRLPASVDVLVGLPIGLAVMVAFSLSLRRDWRRVRSIETDGGAWVLRNPFGVRLGRIDPGEPRVVQGYERKAWSFDTTARRYTQSWGVIESGARRWQTGKSTPAAQAKAFTALRRPPFAG